MNFYYAAGLIGKLTGQTFDFDVSPEEMSAAAQEALKNYTPKDDGKNIWRISFPIISPMRKRTSR